MEKLKYVKLENIDGSYSSPIPFAVDSDNVDVNGYTLTEVLGELAPAEIDSTINAQSTNVDAAGAKAVYDLYLTIINGNEVSW